MAKILTGVQSTEPTFRNLLGAIIPAIQLNDPKMNHSFSLPIYIPQIRKTGQIPIAQQQLGWLVD
jgi:hypothetical protein